MFLKMLKMIGIVIIALVVGYAAFGYLGSAWDREHPLEALFYHGLGVAIAKAFIEGSRWLLGR